MLGESLKRVEGSQKKCHDCRGIFYLAAESMAMVVEIKIVVIVAKTI